MRISKRASGEMERSENTSCIFCSSNFFSLKYSICQGAIFLRQHVLNTVTGNQYKMRKWDSLTFMFPSFSTNITVARPRLPPVGSTSTDSTNHRSIQNKISARLVESGMWNPRIQSANCTRPFYIRNVRIQSLVSEGVLEPIPPVNMQSRLCWILYAVSTNLNLQSQAILSPHSISLTRNVNFCRFPNPFPVMSKCQGTFYQSTRKASHSSDHLIQILQHSICSINTC